MEILSGFTKTNLVPKSSIDDTFMQDHQRKSGEMTSLPDSVDQLSGKNCNVRESSPRNLFVLTHFRRRPGRPPKQRSDVPASQPSRRGRGRPRKQRLDENPVSQPLRRVPGRPRKQRLDVQVSATTNAPEAVASPPGPPLGSSCNRPLEVPFNREEERETKLKLNPLLRLKKPPKTNHTAAQMPDEELKKVIHKVEYLLVQKLLTSSGNDVDCMIHQANTTFTYLKGFGVDYGSFYRDVTEYIEHRYNFHDAEREETMLSFSVWGGNYLNSIRSADDAKEVIVHTRGVREKVKVKKETLKRQIEDLKQELAHIENEDERLKHDEMKYKEVYEVAEAKKQELGTQLESAQAKLREIKQRKNAALVGIESTTRRLKSTFHDDLDCSPTR